jgi:hypothetical protein
MFKFKHIVSIEPFWIPGNGFCISYCTDTGFYGSDTTAIVVGEQEAFLILNGDHREQLFALIGNGLEDCLLYYLANKDQWNSYTDPIF